MKLKQHQKEPVVQLDFPGVIAEEIAKGIRLLELFGFPGIKNLNQYYKLINKKKFEKLTIIKKNNKSNKSSLLSH